MCIACFDYEDPQVAELVKSGIPCVTVDHIYRRIPAVLSDNEHGAQEAARELGLRIPEDISFAGYDGIPVMQSIKSRLTTVRQKSDVIGEVAARLLIARIEDPGSVGWMPVFVPVELLEGGTVGRVE